jgi:hypothetical protein
MRDATIWRRVTHRRATPPGARTLVPLAGALALAVALSGCLGSSFAYVSHNNPDGTELYFKIPARWTMFNAKQIVTAQNGPLSNAQINQIESGQWINAFNAAPHANIKDLLNETAKYPNGVVIAKQLSVDDRDVLSLQAMRAVLLGADPITATTGGYDVLHYTEYTAPGGIRGSKLTTNIEQSGGLITTFSQVVEVDPQTNWVFAIGIACRASCWGPNQGLINQVLNSWTVKERS